MRGSRNFRQGGGVQVSLTKSSDNVFLFIFFLFFFYYYFLVLSLFYRSQMVNFKEIYHFSRFQRGSNIFQGGGGSNIFQGGGSNCLFPIETHKHGDVLSPILLNLFIDDLVKKLNSFPPGAISINGLSINSLLYADDIVLLANS